MAQKFTVKSSPREVEHLTQYAPKIDRSTCPYVEIEDGEEMTPEHLLAFYKQIDMTPLSRTPQGVPVFLREEGKRVPLCGKIDFTTGIRCLKRSSQPDGRCREHSTATKAVRTFIRNEKRDGRRSKYIPQRLLSFYKDALEDPDLMGLRDETAVVDAFIAEHLQGLDLDATHAAWEKLGKLRFAYQTARDDRRAMILRELFETIESGVAQWGTVEKILNLINHKRGLVETEVKRQDRIISSLSIKEVLMVVGVICDIAIEEFNDQPTRLARFATKLDQRLGGGTLSQAPRLLSSTVTGIAPTDLSRLKPLVEGYDSAVELGLGLSNLSTELSESGYEREDEETDYPGS